MIKITWDGNLLSAEQEISLNLVKQLPKKAPIISQEFSFQQLREELLSNQELLLIVGPTAAGKTIIGLLLAEQLGGEIISLDAFQIYRGLPILTDQPTREQQAAIPHHLVNLLELDETCDAQRYRELAKPVIVSLWQQEKPPILVGGNGFYLKSLLTPLPPLPPGDPTLRREFKNFTEQELQAKITELDPHALSLIDHNNRRRLERVLELLLLTKQPLGELWKKPTAPAYRYRGICLTRDRSELRERIKNRAEQLLPRGVLDEIGAIKKNSLSSTAAQTLGLQELLQLQKGTLTPQEAIATIAQKTARYAKRQETWFRHQLSLPRINLSRYASPTEILPILLEHLITSPLLC